MTIRDKGAESAADITNANRVQISSKLFVCEREAMGTWVVFAFPRVFSSPAAPNGIRRFSTYVCQNVAGLWLKYGVSALKAGV